MKLLSLHWFGNRSAAVTSVDLLVNSRADGVGGVRGGGDRFE